MSEWTPAVRVETVQVATPAVSGRAPPQSTAAPSRKVTAPVGVAPGPATVAVRSTTAPWVDGWRELASATEAGARSTVRVTGPVAPW